MTEKTTKTPKNPKADKTAKKEADAAVAVNVVDNAGKNIATVDIRTYYPETELSEGYSPAFIHQILLSYLDNQRQATAKTKRRGEVKGGGRKPWRQKGTGRARAGTSRSPLWRKGGNIFGPTGIQNFSKKVTKKLRQKALRYALLEFVAQNKLIVIDKFDTSIDKTGKLMSYLKKFPLATANLLVLDNESLSLTRFADNLDIVRAISVSTVGPLDLFRADTLICSKASLDQLLQRISGQPQATETVTKETK